MNLTASELLTAMKYCLGDLGGDSCKGCPNAEPGSMDIHGMCNKCRFDLNREVVQYLEETLKKEGKEG